MALQTLKKDATIPDSAPHPSAEPELSWAIRCAGAFLVLTAFVVFWNGLPGVFIADDHILEQPISFAQTVWPLRQTVAIPGIGGRPVLSLSFALNRIIAPAQPWHFRIVNIAIHAAAGLLLFGLVRRAIGHYAKQVAMETERPIPSEVANPRFAIGFAFAVALLWLVHPLQTASVTYIMQRAESLTGLLLLLTLYAAVRRFDGGGPFWTLLAVAACILGMGVKQTMFAAPALVLLYDYTFVAGGFSRALRTRPGLYAGLSLSWALLAALIVVCQLNDPHPEFGARNPWPYALSQPGVILYYLRLAFWPDPIVALYAWPYAKTAVQIVPPLLAVGVLAGLTLWGLWRRSWIGFVGAWLFLILAPSSSFAALEQLIQCHRMYLPLAAVSVLTVVAVCVMLGWIVRRTGGETHWIQVVAVVLLACVAAWLAWGAMRRNLVYRNELAFWQDNVARQPESRAALSALGSEYSIRNLTTEAEASFRRALEVDDSPMPVDVYYNLGLLTLRGGRFDEALSHFRAAHDLRPYHAGTVEKIGATLAAQGKFPAAVEQLDKALNMLPDAAVAAAAHNNLGAIRSHQGRLQQAAAHYRLAIELQPNSSEAYGNLGSTLVRLNQFEEALVSYEAALRLKPSNADLHNNLGFALLKLQRYNAAAAEFRVALGIEPNHELAQRNLQTAIGAQKSGSVAPPIGDSGQKLSSEPSLP